ncbi:MAG: hypothetical protein CMD98_06820 [Gammaproteobacteria bacterium]|nr:hypothetical protein [Gammaproteobacteria bacterium]|tara:strand:+ start:35282 stop:36370 length:1089 start_codon:yes stop_codon:yes gene_type:complete
MKKFRSFLTEKRADTTQNASVTELFPALAFNHKFHPTSVEDFKKFLYKTNLKGVNAKKSFQVKDASSAALVIERLPLMKETFSKTKIENAIGITNYLYDLHDEKPISKVVWGYRAKPKGIPKSHAGDIFVLFTDKSWLGISLKAGAKKSREPLYNTYVGTQYDKRGWSKDKLAKALWTQVYKKIPGVTTVGEDGIKPTAKEFYKNTKQRKKIVGHYVDMFEADQSAADELYHKQVKVCITQLCKEVNKMSNADFIDWLGSDFNLEKKGEKVPLILVKAVGKTADRKGDDLAPVYKTITGHIAYRNKKSVQEWLIDVFLPEGKLTLTMVCRSDSGVRREKGTSGQGRLGQFLQLKVLYTGVKK